MVHPVIIGHPFGGLYGLYPFDYTKFGVVNLVPRGIFIMSLVSSYILPSSVPHAFFSLVGLFLICWWSHLRFLYNYLCFRSSGNKIIPHYNLIQKKSTLEYGRVHL
jgi:hypothetical protein